MYVISDDYNPKPGRSCSGLAHQAKEEEDVRLMRLDRRQVPIHLYARLTAKRENAIHLPTNIREKHAIHHKILPA